MLRGKRSSKNKKKSSKLSWPSRRLNKRLRRSRLLRRNKLHKSRNNQSKRVSMGLKVVMRKMKSNMMCSIIDKTSSKL